MTNKIRYIILILVGVLTLFFIGIMGYMNGEGHDEGFRVSVIVESNSSERWSVLKQGMESAAKEFNVEVNFITINNESSVSECMDAVKRELLNGTDGLILDLPNINRMVKELDSMAVDTQIVMVESEIPVSKGYNYIAPDNYQMGYDLGSAVIEKKKENETIGIVAGSTRKTANVERKNGILAAVGEENVKWIWEGSRDASSSEIQKMLQTNPVDYIIGMNSTVTEEILDAVGTDSYGSVFGIGNTEKIVYYVDKGVIDTLIAPNEYIMGYQSVKNMYHRLRYEDQGDHTDIDYLIINKQNLYDMQNQKLMFPMVQ